MPKILKWHWNYQKLKKRNSKMEKEAWVDIIGYEQNYQLSNFGNVRSKEHSVIHPSGIKYTYKAKDRKPFVEEYRIISLSKKGEIEMFKISRLVAQHFIPNSDNKPQVNHKDGNKMNDHYSNLEWVTQSENSIHAFDNGLNKRKHKVSGVFFEKRRNKWAAYLYRNNSNIFIGRFATEADAVLKRQEYASV